MMEIKLSVRQQTDVLKIMQILRTQHYHLYRRLEAMGMHPGTCDYVFAFVVIYTITQADKNPSPTKIYQQFQHRYRWMKKIFRSCNISQRMRQSILIHVIQLTLNAHIYGTSAIQNNQTTTNYYS